MTKTMTALALILSATTVNTASAADLRMSWWGGDSRHAATQEALLVCGEKHGHTIAPEFTGWSGHLEKVTTQLAGGTEADIMQINWPWLPLFSINGDGFADLNDFADTIDLSQWTDEQRGAATMKGRLNGLPLSTAGRVFMFNKTTFDAAGLDVPTTWAELIAAAPVMKEKLGDDYYPFYATGLNGIMIVSMITTQNTGKDLIDPESGEVAWTPEELTASLEFYQNLVDQGVTRSWKETAADGNVQLYETPTWADGHIAGSYEWDSTYFKYSDPMNDDQELVPVDILQVDGAKTQGVYRKPSMVFAISKRSENQEAAAEILNCLLTEPEGITALGVTRGLPASAIAASTLAEAGSINQTLIDANRIVMGATGPNVSPFNEHPEVREIFSDALEMFAYGNISAEDAAAEIIDGINDVVSGY